MKKFSLVSIFIVLLLVGCTLGNTPTSRVEDLLLDYQMLDNSIDIDYIALIGDDLALDLRGDYEEVIRKQYKGLSYEIKDEEIDGDYSLVTVEIEVMDYKKAIGMYDRGNYDLVRYQKLVLEELKNTKEMVTYTIEFELTKDDEGIWTVNDLGSDINNKLLGIYQIIIHIFQYEKREYMNKKNLWFLTLFSLVLVLSIYYVTMPSDLLKAASGSINEGIIEDDIVVDIDESDVISALKVEDMSDTNDMLNELSLRLVDGNISVEEKNTVYEQIQSIYTNSGLEETIEKKIENTYKCQNFTKIEDTSVKVVVDNCDNSKTLANNIMRLVQEQFDNKMYVSVQFES